MISPPPRWDLTPIYPSLTAPQLDADLARLRANVDTLERLLDLATTSATADASTMIESILTTYNAILATSWHIESYLMARTDTDAADTGARARAADLRPLLARRDAAGHRVASLIGTLDLDPVLAVSSQVRDLEYPLRRLQAHAQHALPPAAESLVAALHACSGAAWTRLHADLSATITATLLTPTGDQVVPLSTLRCLATDPDRTLRHRAFLAEAAAWERHAVPLSAALNAIKGETLTLSARRGWPTPLDAALADHGLDRQTVDALLAATEDALPDFRRHLGAKARFLGLPRLAPYDLAAPIGDPSDAPHPSDGQDWSFPATSNLIRECFHAYSPALGALTDRAFAERWVDAEPRPGKRGGGLCLWFEGGVSRIRLEYRPGYDGVRTLAHELGHAYHAAVLHAAGRPAFQLDSTPAPLAETASKFCEHLAYQALTLRESQFGNPAAQLSILDGYLTAAHRSIVGSLERFRFEERLFTLRRDRDLSVAELNALTLAVRAETVGDALDPTVLDPWTWVSLPHLYLDGVSFSNLPYLFAQLFALGLADRHAADPATFVPAFDDFLAGIGGADPLILAARLGIDLHSPAVWQAGLASIRADIEGYEALAATH